MKRSMPETFLAARKVGTPIIAIRTQDQAGVVNGLRKYSEENNKSFTNLKGKEIPVAVVTWDIVRGVIPINNAGKQAIAKCAKMQDPMSSTNLLEVLEDGRVNLPENTILFLYNVQRFLDRDGVAQAIWNLREDFKESLRCLVLICPDLTLPAELQPDVLVLDDPLPDAAALEVLVLNQHEAAQVKAPKPEILKQVVSAVAGLSTFPAEQTIAMSLTKDGIDVEQVWERKCQQIEQQPGLSVWRGKETFDDIGGCDNVKDFLRSVLNGNDRPWVIAFVDEIEKSMAGAQGDTSGVSQGMHGTLLTEMQNKNSTGCLFVGPPGAAKSMVAKAAGNTGGIPTIAFDLSGMKASLVGQSEQNLRAALKVLDAVGQGKVLYIATCNSLANLSPELRRRFNFGTFYFDLPTEEERELIWKVYLDKYKVDRKRPDDTDWTGAEIRMCCDIAWRLKISLDDASKYIVPVAKSAQDAIKRLRAEASGKFISAATPGMYEYDESPVPKSRKGQRRMNINDN